MLAKEKIKMTAGNEIKVTKKDEIRGLKGMIECMKKFENFSEKELNEIYKEELKKINKKYENK